MNLTVYVTCWSGTNKEWLQETLDSIEMQGIRPKVVYDERHAAVKWTEALDECETEFIHFAHDAETYKPGFYKKTIGFLEEHPECSAVFTCDIIINENGDRLGQTILPFPTQDTYDFKFIFDSMMKFGNFLRCPSVVFRVPKVKGLSYPLDCDTACDTAMWFNALIRGPIGILPEFLYIYRQTPKSDTQANVVGSVKAFDHTLALNHAAKLRPDLVDYQQRIALAKGTEDRENAVEAKRLFERSESAKEVEFYVVHEPPENAGTGILVADRVRRRNREDTDVIGYYVCPNPQGTLPPQVVKGVPTLFCHPNGFQQLVDKYVPNRIEYHHLLRWPISILGASVHQGDGVGKTLLSLWLHDSSLWCARWHSINKDNEVCNEPSPEKCEACCQVQAVDYNRKQQELKKYLPLMDGLYANSEYTAKWANKWLLGVNIDEDAPQSSEDASGGAKRFIIENPVVPEMPLYRKRIKIGYFGGFYPVKGVHILLDAMQKVKWGQLLMFCDVPQEFLKGRQIYGHDNVLVMGAYVRSDLPLLYNLVDLIICPSINESYCLTAREAIMLGKRVIATNVGGMSDIGIVEGGNADSLARFIQEVIDEKIHGGG